MWGVVAALALLWPGRLNGPLDGLPLDGVLEAVVIGVGFPALWWFHPRFLATRFSRAAVVALLAWKALTAVFVVQDGWCVRFVPTRHFVKDGLGEAPHSWDLRADWRRADPTCSAVMTRAFDDFSSFPAWFYNLPPPDDNWPVPADRPPGATTAMTVSGFLRTRDADVLQIVTGPDVTATLAVDGRAIRRTADDAPPQSRLAAGVHTIQIDATLTGDRWQLMPLLNGADLWRSSAATLKRPSRLDAALRPWAAWVSAFVITVWALGWVLDAARRRADPNVLAWAVGACSSLAILAAAGSLALARSLVAGLAGATLLPVSARSKNLYGAFALFGLPWLALIVASSAPLIGHFTMYESGNDYWTFQRHAYRIFLQGYWLEGGEKTFWFQPLYRWIAALLHAVFGDSSVGEWYWDGACVLTMALFAFRSTKAFAGFRWGLASGVLTLAMFTMSVFWGFIGVGLSEISSAGLVYGAALLAMKSRHRRWRLGIAAGVVATLAFYTRLNNAPMAAAVAAFAWPIREPASTLLRPTRWTRRMSLTTVAAVAATLSVGLMLFALRTWHYTGRFSIVLGTALDPDRGTARLVWQPGMSFRQAVAPMFESVMFVLTAADPPRMTMAAIPLITGAVIALVAASGQTALGRLPLSVVVFFLSSLAGSLIARGTAYAGRFSIHVIPVACAVNVCALSLLMKPFIEWRRMKTARVRLASVPSGDSS
jgi:hypothetical protein